MVAEENRIHILLTNIQKFSKIDHMLVHQMSYSKFKKRINITHWSKKWALKFKLQVQSLGQEDPLEKEMATDSSILAWKIHRQRSLQGYSPWVLRIGHNWVTQQYPRGKVTTNAGGLKIRKTDGGQEEKGTTEDEMAGWHHRLDGHEFEQAPGAGNGQGGLATGSQRVRHHWATKLNWKDWTC